MNLPPAILTVLGVLRRHQVRALLMGGQACIVYGASEFSRDIDFAIVADEDNFQRLLAALSELQAAVIAVPPAAVEHLHAGLAVHFRCASPGVEGLRVDVMSHMRGVAPFEELWARRELLPDGSGVLSLPDLVQAKKTQRDKDWPMIRRLIEADTIRHPAPDADRLAFWLNECRTPAILLMLAADHPFLTVNHARLVVRAAANAASEEALHRLLREEEDRERAADATWWAPLRKKLEALRLTRP
jgi:hypothetical protein